MDHSATVIGLTQKLLDQLGLSAGVEVSVNYDSKNQLYQVLLQSSRPALLIGFHGETLSAIQLFLGQHLHAQIGEWVNLSVNVNDYRERRESSLTALADTAVSQVLATGQPHSLPPMPANERRVVHMYLSDNPQVTTSSEGTGRSRCIIISPQIQNKG
jgi:spoIIIJ-associated protein